MEDRAPRKNGQSLTKQRSYIPDGLFDLDPLMNIQLPRCNSSTSNEMQIEQRRLNSVAGINGMKSERPVESHSEMTLKRKRVLVEAEAGYNATKRDDADSNDESESSDEFHITEDDYRSMLGEHLKKYRRAQFKEAIAGRFIGSSWKRNVGIVPGSLRANSKKKNPIFRFSRHNRYKVDPDESRDGTAMLLENGWHHSDGGSIPNVLDLGGGVLFGIPPLYDDLAPHLCLPGLQLMQINEKLLAGQFKPASVASMVASDPLGRLWKAQARIGGAYEKDLVSDLSMHTLGSELYDSGTGVKKFSLQILPPQVPENGSSDLGSSDIKHDSAFTLRKILFEDGSKRQCEVKVLERTDGYEVIERKIPQKEPVKIDFMAVAKEDSDKVAKSWSNLVRRDLLKHHKAFMLYHKKQTFDAKKFADCCQREVKARGMRSLKLLKSAPMRIRKLARDMILFWKKLDREQAELKKKEEREAAEALKREEELRESRRQQQRLNFLLTQTELYSHFMQNKLASASTPHPGVEEENIGADLSAEEVELKEEALRVAQNAAMKQKRKLDEFDNACLQFRQTAREEEKEEEMSQQEVDAAAGIDLVNPSSMPTASTVQQPSLFQGILKEYQLKGLQWLVNCYEQGLNGILADEMGLGKTIQAMAFLAHLAEEKNIWGPFLVVAPASVLNNWADEVNRFCPDLKILPYWGAQQERSILRRNLSPKHLYKRDAGFHVLITSYQLLVTDEKYLRRVKWQYMVLDEAQAIKSATSARWKTLLSFNCRNRLLLTGTPIQNNMAELWALLHFIMPTLFDSHEQFNEWFSKGIENHAEHGGTLNEHQLNRLHSILKPFMLRRVKKDVITEMTNKKEVVLPCGLSLRQQAFYQAIKNKISLSDLLDGTRGSLNDKTAMNLMNIVMQLRKVCNHPELFEGNEGRTFVHFSAIPCALLPPPFGEPEVVHYAGGHNPISYKVPKLLYRDGMHCRPTQTSGSIQGFRDQWMHNMFNVFSPVNVHTSSFPKTASSADLVPAHSGTFGFSRLIDMAPSEVGFVARCSIVEKLLFSFSSSSLEVSSLLEDPVVENSEDIIEESKSRVVNKLLLGPFRNGFLDLTRKLATGVELEPFEALVVPHRERYLKNIRLLRSANCFMPAVRAPQIEVVCADRGFAYQREDELHNLRFKRLLLGHARTSECNDSVTSGSCHYLIQERETRIYAQEPLLALPYRIFGSAPPWRSFDCAKMLTDSGKLQTLDALLKVLRAENHKVLLFAQMTKMLNILESYMNHRKYKYLRLDGSSSITDRRDMVNDFQSRDDIFIFLLSTRAGGLGINLTAADTVIFYESDWNPTMDLQAMDRAHRLGQTREVTVYRLICKGTVEEKIVQRAGQKSTVQQLVMTGGQSQGDIFNVEEVVSMLLDDAEIKKRMTEQTVKTGAKTGKRKRAVGGGSGAKVIRVDDEGIASFEEGTAIDNKPPPQAINSLESANKQRQGKRIKDVERNAQKRSKTTPKSTPKTNKESKAKTEVISDMKYDVEPKHSDNPRQRPNSQKGAPETSATWRPSIKVIKINKDYEDSKFDTTTMPLETMHGSG